MNLVVLLSIATIWLKKKKTKFEKIWQYGKLQQFKPKTYARKWHVSIERCEMDKKVKNINDAHVYKNKYYT